MSISALMDTARYLEKRRRENKLETYRPYPKQEAFHNSIGKDTQDPATERMLSGGNQCVSPWTYIETAEGSRLASGVFALPNAHVTSLAGESECDSQVAYGILRGIEPAFRLVMESGQYFDCSPSHQVLTEHGYSRIDQLMSLSSGLRCIHKRQDYQASCVEDGYLCDPQLLLEEDTVLDALLGRAYARNSILSLSREDAEERISLCTTSPISDRLTISDDGMILHAALYAQFAAPFSPQPFLHVCDRIQEFLQSVSAYDLMQSTLEYARSENHSSEIEIARHEYHAFVNSIVSQLSLDREIRQSFDAQYLGCSLQELHRDTAIFYPLHHPSLFGGNKIIAVLPIGWQPIIDCHVPITNNYKSAGVYHHNCGKTWCGSMEAAMHLTGIYPDWYEGVKFRHPIEMWCAGVSNTTTRDIIQKALLGNPLDNSEFGTGAIPKKHLGKTTAKSGVQNAFESCSVKHHTDGQFDGTSYIYFKSYEQKAKAFFGSGIPVIWLDEGPPQDIYSQCLRAGLAQAKPIIYITMTPEEGYTPVVTQFLNETATGQSVTFLSMDDAEHMTEEMITLKLSKFPEHERDMRRYGTPQQGLGLIFNTPLESMLVDPFEIPPYWYQGIGVDFGWDHPFGAGKLAMDRDNDVLYLIAEYRESKAIPAIHATSIKGWGDYPIFWPHDGLNSEKGTGEQLITKYRDAGLPMFYKKTTNPPPMGKMEGEGGNSVEASLLAMNERMQTGRFKIFRTCRLFQEEFRMYHRKDVNGKSVIVKMQDDIISAVRAACMMNRHFKNGTVTRAPVQHMRKGRRNFGR